MSVINKMLRDLDHRRAANTPMVVDGTVAVHIPAPQNNAAQVPLSTERAKMPRNRPWVWLAGLAVLVTLAVGAWVVWQPSRAIAVADAGAGRAEPVTVAPLHTASSPLSDLPVPESRAAVPALVTVTSVPATVAPGAVVLRMEESLSAGRAIEALLLTPVPAPARVAAPPVTRMAAAAPAPTANEAPALAPDRSQRPPLASSTALAPQPVVAVAKPAATPLPDTPPNIQRQQQAGGDALVQAQSLWNSGSREAAVELMQQSIAAAERSAKAGANPGANGLLLPLVRELARMQLAEGRFGAVWELLSRLEPFLGNQSDLWAIRANAAQRLGRHQDSVHAYLVALQSRPNEQRWLLGTAVSLAALGQTSSATEMAEKARAVAPVSKEIATYLRQAGVAFKE